MQNGYESQHVNRCYVKLTSHTPATDSFWGGFSAYSLIFVQLSHLIIITSVYLHILYLLMRDETLTREGVPSPLPGINAKVNPSALQKRETRKKWRRGYPPTPRPSFSRGGGSSLLFHPSYILIFLYLYSHRILSAGQVAVLDSTSTYFF